MVRSFWTPPFWLYDNPSIFALTTVQQTAAKRSSSKVNKAIEAYVSFSTAHLLRMNIEPPPDGHEDPELDVEAQFSQRAGHSAQQSTVNNKCLSGWCWCKFSLADQTHALRSVRLV